MIKSSSIDHLVKKSKNFRKTVLKMVADAGSSHVGSSLSMIEILTVLYGDVLKLTKANLQQDDRNRLFVSKGHAAAAVYAGLAEFGLLPREVLKSFCKDGSPLIGHASHIVPGVELSTGSLGHALSFACGVALAGQRAGKGFHNYVILSDGEMGEGSNWEAILFAGHHQLKNLTIIIDYNKIQSLGNVKDILDLEPLGDKLRAFKWDVTEVNGHDMQALKDVFQQQKMTPKAIIAHTVKGKGVQFMEGQLKWHYKSPNPEETVRAINEVML